MEGLSGDAWDVDTRCARSSDATSSSFSSNLDRFEAGIVFALLFRIDEDAVHSFPRRWHLSALA